MEKKNMVCINCPMGCNLEVEIDGKDIVVRGNNCKRGEEYAKNEVTNPKRIVTSTIRVYNGEKPMVSVKTEHEIPKDKIFDIMKAINETRVNAPVEIGDVVINNILDTGVNIIATSSVKNNIEK